MTIPEITSLAVASSPVLKQALMISRGGAAVLAAQGATSIVVDPLLTSLRGGAAAKAVDPSSKSLPFDLSLDITPQGKSVIFMAMAMAFHYLGYSVARSITVTLFTSSSTGYADMPGAYPFAMAFVSPLALLLLMGYGKILEENGPVGALKGTTLGCSGVVALVSAAVAIFEKSDISLFGIPAMKFVTGPFYIFRESYVQLLTAQYWSFMASALTPSQSTKWFAPISGLTSIASALGGLAVKGLVNKVGLAGSLLFTSIGLILSLLTAQRAYEIADEHGFTPKDTTKKTRPTSQNNKSTTKDVHEMGAIERARTLFARVPVLKALFLEILASQGLATLLNVCFVSSLGSSITDDTVRAGWVGNFYAIINLISMALQFGVLPFLMQVIEPKDLWRVVPIISACFTTFQASRRAPTLYIVSASLMVMKVLEYSARRMLDEMVYVPLDFESRYVGKEIIGVFGYRFGKSAMSLSLSALTSLFGNFNLQQLSILSNVAAIVWAKSTWNMSNLVPTRSEAEAAYSKSHEEPKNDDGNPFAALLRFLQNLFDPKQ